MAALSKDCPKWATTGDVLLICPASPVCAFHSLAASLNRLRHFYIPKTGTPAH